MLSKFFLVVYMAANIQTGVTPLYILQYPFNELETCVKWAQKNKNAIFNQAVTHYEFKIMPRNVVCMRKDVLDNILEGKPMLEDIDPEGIPL